MRKLTATLVVLVSVGIVSTSIGTFLIYYFGKIMEKKVIESVILKEGSDAFVRWKENQCYVDFYFFNVTNSEEISSSNVKPIVDELGPYTYRVTKMKVNVDVSEDNGSISYKERKLYVFEPKLGFSEEDSIFILNMPAIVISKIIEEKFPKFISYFVKLLLAQEKLFERRTVKEIIWGYNATLAIEINDILKRFLLPLIDFPEFGLYVGAKSNGSISGTFNISSGVNGITDLGRIHSWDGKDELPFWSGKDCNKINGTDGTFWSPFISKSSRLYVYSPDVCRSLHLQFDSSVKLFNSLTYKFVVPPTDFQDFRNISELQCFCVPNVASCLKQGVLDVSLCNGGAPIVLSMPHFLYSDQDYINAIHPMRPNASKHETYINVEPTVGLALEAHKRLQINILLKKYDTFPATKKVENYLIFPIAWVDENGIISPEDAEKLNKNLYKPLMIAQCIQYGLITFGCICLLLVITVLVSKVLLPKKNISISTDVVDEVTPLLKETQAES